MTDTPYYDKLRSRCKWEVNVSHFNEDDARFLWAGVELIDALGEEWELIQIKTKFSFDDLRFYVSGSRVVQEAARLIEEVWYKKYYEGEE